jgi:CHAD domain-containing protein
MVRMGRAIEDSSPPEALHDLRKQGKELRYLLELFGALFDPASGRPLVRTLKSLQDTLGRHQDRSVQAALMRSLATEAAASEPAAALAAGALIERLHEDELAARAEFAERFPGFAARDVRRRVRESFL